MNLITIISINLILLYKHLYSVFLFLNQAMFCQNLVCILQTEEITINTATIKIWHKTEVQRSRSTVQFRCLLSSLFLWVGFFFFIVLKCSAPEQQLTDSSHCYTDTVLLYLCKAHMDNK